MSILEELEFNSTTTYEDWQKLVELALRDASSSKKLLRDNYENFHYKPLYHESKRDEHSHLHGYPGAYPYIRGAKASGNTVDGWKIAQTYNQSEPKKVNEQIRADIEGGVDCFNFYINSPATSGISITNEKSLDELFADTDITKYEIGLHSKENILLNTCFFSNYFRTKKIPLNSLKINFNADPLQVLARTGSLPFSLDRTFSHLAEVNLVCEKYLPQAKAFGVSSSCYHNAGANASQELAFTLATFVEYLVALQKAGLPAHVSVKRAICYFSLDSQIFMNIAKIRAFRFLIARVLEEFGAEAGKVQPAIYVRSSLRMMTLYDPWINILRSTMSTWSAAQADVQYIEAVPFDRIHREAYSEKGHMYSDLALRLSRNTQHILAQESLLSKVSDPMGGSWLVEDLTQTLAKQAWTLFQEIERMGGMAQALKQNWVHKQIEEIKQKRLTKIRTRQQMITGVNDYTNAEERISENWGPLKEGKIDNFDKNVNTELSKILVQRSRDYVPFDFKSETFSDVMLKMFEQKLSLAQASQLLHSEAQTEKINKIVSFRDSSEFEALRLEVESNKALAQTKVFLKVLGDYSTQSLRINFCQNVFEILGFAVSDSGPEKTEIQGQDIIVLCGDKKQIQEFVGNYSLKTKNPPIYFVTGKWSETELKEIEQKIKVQDLYMGKNIYEMLFDLVEKLKRNYE
ncbi:MAG: hypothetical protein JNM93_02280 [Bacteriovoracaceae bacterium]|nr:hypothetical protein [Bacteriovoracaceae bacterium]